VSSSAIQTILGAQLLALRNRVAKRGTARLAVLAVFVLIAVIVIGGGAFTLGDAAGQFLPMARDALLVGAFTALAVLVLVVGFPSVIATFFVGRDLLQLVVAPVRPVEIFVARALLAMSANLLISGILVAALLGVGIGSGASLIYYPLTLLLVFVEVLGLTAFQAILMSLVLRWVPSRLARDIAAAVAALAGIAFYIAWNLSVRPNFRPRHAPDLTNLTTLVQRVEWLPSAWPGHALNAVVAGNASSALAWTLITLVFALLLVAAASMLYERTLLAGLGLFGGGQSVWKRGPARLNQPAGTGAGSPGGAIARKDWLGYRRDVRRLTRLLPALLFPIAYALSLVGPSRAVNGFWSDVFLAVFISMFMSTSLAVPSIPSEHRGFQLLRMSPLSMWRVMQVKIMLTLPPVLALTMLLTLAIGLAGGNDVAQLVQLAGLVVWLAIGFVAIGVSAGAIDPHFEAADDRRAVGMIGTLSVMGGALGFASLTVGSFALIRLSVLVAAGASHLGPVPSTPLIGLVIGMVGLVLAAGAAAVVAVLLAVGNSRLRSYEGVIT
jgi:hypothetical protein